MRWLVLLCLVGCGVRSDDTPPAVSPVPSPPVATPSTPAPIPTLPVAHSSTGPCATLPRAHCLERPDCTLDQPQARSRQYVCRDAVPPCEVGMVQAQLDRGQCEAQSGCVFHPASCYCHCRGMGRTAVEDGPEAPGCDCECGGGPPAMCAPR